MEPTPKTPDVELAIYLDGRLIRSVRIGPEELPTVHAGGPPRTPARALRVLRAVLPADGRLALAVELSSRTAAPLVTETVYDDTGRVVDAGSGPPPGEPPSPDEPRIVG